MLGDELRRPDSSTMHSHSDVLFLNRSILEHKVRQGVTTELIGQDGMSLAPLTDSSRKHMQEMVEPLSSRLMGKWVPWEMRQLLDVLAERGVCLNVVTLVGTATCGWQSWDTGWRPLPFRAGPDEEDALGRAEQGAADSP